MMHLRRRLAESLSLMDLTGLDEKAVERLPEVKALVLIGKIYDADEKLKTLTADERKARRDREVRPLLEDYFQYIEILRILLSSSLGEILKNKTFFIIKMRITFCAIIRANNKKEVACYGH